MKTSINDFTGFSEFLRLLKPCSPYGRSALESPALFTRREELEPWYDKVALLVAYQQRGRELRDRLEYHLRRLPEIPDPDQESFSGDDIFLVKRFLFNLRSLSVLLPGNVREAFSLLFELDDLLSELSRDGSDENFQIAEGFSPELAFLRKDLRCLDAEIAGIRHSRCTDIHSRTGLDFSVRDFILLDPDRAGTIPTDLVYREPYDSKSFILRPVMPEEYYTLYARREHLAEKEVEAETVVMADLGRHIYRRREKLKTYRVSVTIFEKAWITASAALEYRMVRPEIACDGVPPSVLRGRCLPLCLECSHRGVDYQELSFSPESAVSIIRGPNMGGKTALLKSMGFFQLLVQTGFFVPAVSCRLSLFDSLHTVTAAVADESFRGLSRYGAEVLALAEALSAPGERRFLLVDEFGSTTTSRDARALNEALVEVLVSRGCGALLATHILDLRVPAGVSMYRMKGLRREGLESLSEALGSGDLDERIKFLNKHMIYTPEPEKEENRESDALVIAGCLGLDKDLIGLAAKKMGLKNG